jgi:hypothetical protein
MHRGVVQCLVAGADVAHRETLLTLGVVLERPQLDLRPATPNVRCHSAWYLRSRRHSISVGMPLQASETISTMIGEEATSKSMAVIAVPDDTAARTPCR